MPLDRYLEWGFPSAVKAPAIMGREALTQPCPAAVAHDDFHTVSRLRGMSEFQGDTVLSGLSRWDFVLRILCVCGCVANTVFSVMRASETSTPARFLPCTVWWDRVCARRCRPRHAPPVMLNFRPQETLTPPPPDL